MCSRNVTVHSMLSIYCGADSGKNKSLPGALDRAQAKVAFTIGLTHSACQLLQRMIGQGITDNGLC